MIEATNSNFLSFQNMQKMHVNDTISSKEENDTQSSKTVSLSMDTAIFSQTAMDLSQNKNTSLLSILENQSQGQTPAERAADGRRAAQAMRTENEAEDMKLGTLVIENNQEAMEQDIEEAKAERENANSENSSEASSSSSSTTSNSSSSESSSTKSETSSESNENPTASE